MSVIVLFMVGIAIIAGWWLSQQHLMVKPWLEEGIISNLPGGRKMSLPPVKVGLGIFLAVVGSLFALVISAHLMRMDLIDWRPLPIPKLLWFNTGALILSSLALHWGLIAVRREDGDGVLAGLLGAGISAAAFLFGQLLAWQQLISAGYFAAANPANAFFYLITAAHGLHLIGGLIALGRTTARAWRGFDVRQLRLSVELCATYWHFLLLIWLVLLGLLTGWASEFVALCRQLIL